MKKGEKDVKTSKNGDNQAEKAETISRHFWFPKELYELIEDENTIEKRNSGTKVSKEQTIFDLIREGIAARQEKRESEKTEK